MSVLASPTLAETVHFRSATTLPTPLRQRLARERGTPIDPQPTTDLIDELYRPPGTAPYPAVVALHGCAGRGSKAYAAIAYYPACRTSRGDVCIPTLVLIGALDDWTPALDSEAMMLRRTGEGAPLQADRLSWRYHAFDEIGRAHV